jgi:TM2 domain-containing membrane protein YozV
VTSLGLILGEETTTIKNTRAISRCVSCGRSIDAALDICPYCGASQGENVISPTVPQSKSTKSRTTAALLAILLGSIGAHKFYLGDLKTGIAYLIFCWTYIPGVLGVIEGILYLLMKDEDFARKYG